MEIALRYASQSTRFPQPPLFYPLLRSPFCVIHIPPLRSKHNQECSIMSSNKRSFKRPSQPSISSYFGQTRNSDCSPVTASQNSILSPILPNTVQSSLLNVGMRVRKAVPDGYMTRPKTFCGFPMPFDGSASQSERSTHHSRSASSGLSNLLPYCGTLKVGGHAMQQVVPAEEDIPPLQFDPDDWGFPSSQESNASTISTTCMVATPQFRSAPRTAINADAKMRMRKTSIWIHSLYLRARDLSVIRACRTWMKYGLLPFQDRGGKYSRLAKGRSKKAR